MLILQIVGGIAEYWGSCKTIERQIEPYTPIPVNQIIQEEESNIAIKILKQIKETCISLKRFIQRTLDTRIETANAFQGQIETIIDEVVDASLLVDRRLAIDPPVGKQDVCPNRQTSTVQIFRFIRDL